jgi:hypothetical protein
LAQHRFGAVLDLPGLSPIWEQCRGAPQGIQMPFNLPQQ